MYAAWKYVSYYLCAFGCRDFFMTEGRPAYEKKDCNNQCCCGKVGAN